MKTPFVFMLLFVFYSLIGQEIPTPLSWEEKLAQTGRLILEHPEFKKRDSANTLFTQELQNYLSTEEALENPLLKVTNMMRLTIKDADFCIYTWQMPNAQFEYEQFGLVASKTRKGIEVTLLQSQSKNITDADFKILKADQWYGAVYYKILPVKKGKNTLYTLLGFAPGNSIHQKIIDVIEIDRRGRPRFGNRIFRVDQFMDKTFRKPPSRLILSYSSKYAASVNWHEEEKMIIMDHLSPPEPKLKGIYNLYGPDMSYDGLYWKDDWWHLKENIHFKSKLYAPLTPPDRPVGPREHPQLRHRNKK